MCLSIRGAGSPDVRLHGPVGIMKMYEATENFVILFDFRVMYHNPENDPVYSDSAITVKHIPLKAEIDTPIISPEPKYCKWVPDMDFTNKGNAIYIKLCTVLDVWLYINKTAIFLEEELVAKMQIL